ncbi:MAG: family 14 glycosylhydrolase [Opitutaceae bacterium]|nr:family 14 glycosylhydrolase [Cephaloticoccus sp.]MCP5529293.1 family 14 glycosylhydrolase [Opitutaceae bacterium]
MRRLVIAILLVLRFAWPLPAAEPAGAPMTITVNSWDLSDEADVVARLIALKQLGVTSIQTYIYWNKVEQSPGVLDWSAYDREARLYQKHGLKWVPFVIVGPWYLTPDFVRADPAITMYRCLEHGRDSAIPSLWSPRLRDYVRGFLARFAEHFGPMGVLESVNLGVTGDYGEAIYPVIGNWPGAYHSHAGYWCGDALAAADFRAHLRGLYPAGVAALNQAWQTRYASWDEVRPFVPGQAPSERAWQEMLAWYRGAMTDWAEFWLATTRELLPGTDIYLCTGGDMAPEHGSDFSAQAKVAARYHAGIRITNEASSYPANVRLTRMVASASRFYGAYFGHEPAALVTPDGMLGRQFNAVTSGARQLFAYLTPETIIRQPDGTYAAGPAGRHYLRNHALMRVQRPVVGVAWYQAAPARAEQAQDRRDLADLSTAVRRFVDYDMLDDRLIREGALRDKQILLLFKNQVMPAEVLARIRQWVEAGGIAFFFDSRGADFDGRSEAYDQLLGLTAAADKVTGINLITVRDPAAYPSIASLADLFGTTALVGLAPECETLLGMEYAPNLAVAWRHPVGAGRVYAYFGPIDLKVDEESWVTAKRVPLRFLRDSLRQCLAEGLLPAEPASLNLDEPDVYKVLTTEGLWVLNLRGTAATIPVDGQPVEVPAKSITLCPPAADAQP